MPKLSLYVRRGLAVSRAVAASLAALAIVASNSHVEAQTPEPPPCAACVVLAASPGQTLLIGGALNGTEVLLYTRADDGADLEPAVQAIRGAGGLPGLWVDGLAVAPRHAPAVSDARRVVLDLSGETTGIDELAFRLKTQVTELRGLNPTVQVGVHARPEVVAALVERGLNAYIDLVARRAQRPPAFPRSLAAADRTFELLRPGAADGDRSLEGWVVFLPADVLAARNVLADVSTAAPLLTRGLVAGGTVEVTCGGRRLPTYLDAASLDTIAVSSACADRPVQIAPEVPGAVHVRLSTGDLVVRVPSVEGERFAEGVQVVGARRLSVREIVARHQAAAARARREIHHLIATGTMTLTFEAPGFPAPLTITADTVIYTAPDRVEIEQRDIRVNGLAFAGGRVPRLPLLEPERVASPPLAITLTDVYRYELDGEDDVRGVPCYVVSFEPVDRGRSLFAGRVWIAKGSFAMVKVAAVQTGLRGPIVSSEQIDEFRPEGDTRWVLARSEFRQIYEGAGHRTPIHRVLVVHRHEINPPGFEARRAAAYASPSIMLRETPAGLRYLTREAPGEGQPAAAREPVLAGPAERVRTLALGVIVDPNISRPLPFAGLSYVDFNLFGTGTQFNGFFGGTYGQLAIAVPSLGGTRWQLGGRAFGIASSYNDRAFEAGRENYGANISQRPAHASTWLLRPLSARVTARAGYDFDYIRFRAAESTDPTFRVPVSVSAHALRLVLEGQWAGWSASLWWAGARRVGWREWGYGPTGLQAPAGGPLVAPRSGSYSAGHREYQRTGAVLTRSFVATPRLVGRIEAAWMTGRDLDRFSRYSFGSFDNRLRGYPSALIRYDRGAVVRAATAWAAGRVLRLDGFLDVARVRDPGFGRGLRTYTGIGTAAEVPAPFGTLLAVEWGYGFQGVNADGGKGTQVVRISGYKMF